MCILPFPHGNVHMCTAAQPNTPTHHSYSPPRCPMITISMEPAVSTRARPPQQQPARTRTRLYCTQHVCPLPWYRPLPWYLPHGESWPAGQLRTERPQLSPAPQPPSSLPHTQHCTQHCEAGLCSEGTGGCHACRRAPHMCTAAVHVTAAVWQEGPPTPHTWPSHTASMRSPAAGCFMFVNNYYK